MENIDIEALISTYVIPWGIKIFMALGELADSSVNFLVRPWAKAEDYWGLLWDTTETVKLKFDEAGISIPYPQMDVHLDKGE